MARIKRIAVGWWSACLLSLAISASAEVPPQLEAFEPFVGRTWAATVDPKHDIRDVARWERALGGKAIRILHSLNDGKYGGETLVMWDREAESLVYFYFTTAGFYTQGEMTFEPGGLLVSRESVSGHAGGVSEVEATQRLLPDGRMEVKTRMKVDGAWKGRGVVHYSEAPDAKVVLP